MHCLNDRLLRMLWAMKGAMDTDIHSARLKAWWAYAKSNGFAGNQQNPYGRKRRRLPSRGGKRGYLAFHWDEHQCMILRELMARRSRGESYLSIGLDFQARGEKTQNGKEWLLPRRKTSAGGSEWHVNPLWSAYRWYRALLDSGKDLGDVPLPTGPDVQIPAAIAPPPYARPPKPPPRPLKAWQPKPWQLALLEKWRAEKNGAAKASATPAPIPTSSAESSSSAACPSSTPVPFSPGKSEQLCQPASPPAS
jgi:hypothetical protein